MNVQINTDNHIQGSDDLTRQVESVVESVLGRFGERLTRVEVHLSDENSAQKTHGEPMRCRMEARPAARDPVTVTADAATLPQAVGGAARVSVFRVGRSHTARDAQ